MKYARQTQDALDRLDQALLALNKLIRDGKKQEALQFMEEGPLKERFGEFKNIVILSSTNQLGASGISNIGSI